jgi:hypothetical protein
MDGNSLVIQEFGMNRAQEARELAIRCWSSTVGNGKREERDAFGGAQRRLGLKFKLSNFEWFKQ